MNYLGIEKNSLNKTIQELNQLLANYHIYYQNLRNFHWNIDGENFFDLHEKFEELYNDARQKIDEIAERILILRARPLSQYSNYLEHAEVREAGRIREDRQMVRIVLENHAEIISNMRRVLRTAEESKDEGTIDMIGGFLENIEKKSWMLDAWMARKAEPVA